MGRFIGRPDRKAEPSRSEESKSLCATQLSPRAAWDSGVENPGDWAWR